LRTLLVIAVVALAAAAGSAAHADQFDVLYKVKDTPRLTVWRIDQPNVKQPMTNYPSIRFSAGDSVNVLAAGCVQTGGFGKTWKSYVNPQGPNSDRLYHGLIDIPGVTPGMVRLQNFALNHDHSIHDPLPKGLEAKDMFLRLGYEDDGYGDNGYYSHDDGDNGQCSNVGPAYLIITIGHYGTPAPDPAQFFGIEPAYFRCRAAWAFHNFDSGDLSWSTFNAAFQLPGWQDAWPPNAILYYAGRGIAGSGNCEGMALLAIVGEDQFVVGDLKEYFWQNYKTSTMSPPQVTTDINTFMWMQLSGYFIHTWLVNLFRDATTNAGFIEHDLSAGLNYNYGLLTLMHGTSGHVLVPLAVRHSGSQTLIDVYDPNRPCGGVPDTATYPSVIVTSSGWSYDMGGSDGTWSGSSGLNDGLAYIPYHGPSEWSDPISSLSGITEVIFGADAQVDQVSDKAGHRLFVEGRRGEMEKSASRLDGVVPMPRFNADAEPRRPRQGTRMPLEHPAETDADRAVHDGLARDYGEHYGAATTGFLVPDDKLQDLTFSLTGTNPAHAVHAMISTRGEFFEVSSAATTPATFHPTLKIPSLADLAGGGVMVASGDRQKLNVTFTHGLLSTADKTSTIERTDALPVLGGSLVRFTQQSLKVLSADSLTQTAIIRRTVGSDGKAVEAPARTLAIQALQ
jgi:hypothetical protein